MKFSTLSTMRLLSVFLLAGSVMTDKSHVMAEDGYRMWLRYDLVQDQEMRDRYRDHLRHIIVEEQQSPTVEVAADELR